MLLIVEPRSQVPALILVGIDTVSVLVVLFEKSFIFAGVGPFKDAVAAFDVLNPVANVLPAVYPLVMAEPVDFVVDPVPYIL